VFEGRGKDAGEMKKLSLLLLLALPLVANSQGGNFQSGNKLKTHCAQKDSIFDSAFCMGYIIGVADNNSFLICAPGGSGGVTQGQFTDIVKKYLNDNPAQLHRDADVLVLDALKQAFPCPKKK
jgi:hypothetical protein